MVKWDIPIRWQILKFADKKPCVRYTAGMTPHCDIYTTGFKLRSKMW